MGDRSPPVLPAALHLGPGYQGGPRWGNGQGSGASSSHPVGLGAATLTTEGRTSSLQTRSTLAQRTLGDPFRCFRMVCVLRERKQKCSWRSRAWECFVALRPVSVWPTLTCSLLPAAGTVSVGTSSCLSLSQHPSPTSVFRHHYIPYFRGKARGLRAAVLAGPPRLCLAVLCPPHGFPASRVSRPCSPLCVLCVRICFCQCVNVPWR